MKYLYSLACCLLLMLGNVRADNLTQPFSIVPCPASIVPGTGYFRFTANTVFTAADERQAVELRQFASLFTRAAGFTPRVKVGGKGGEVRLLTDAALPPEAYRLSVTAKGIRVHASGAQGFFYALQSIRQLLPPAIEGGVAQPDTEWLIPAMTITDSPRFGYRGLMMDVARFFTPKENLLRIIDCMAMMKLNKLHLHLVDDNGWRIEIKRYPLLTKIGSRRVDHRDKPFPERRNPRQGQPTVEEGFYTQDDIREIVTYATARHIEVIPEIEMPAHSNAALAAYPLLACPVVDKFIGVLPGLGGNHADIIFCAGNDSVFSFLQGVIDEVAELFPSRYIHLGGDEAWKTHWKECPLCQARMKAEGLKDEEALQGYFMARMARYVQSKGREVMGWDELTNTDIPEDAIIFGWQGYGQAAVKAARQGHRFVMTPARVLYFIRYQGPQWFEPLTYFGNNTLKDVYDYEPVQKEWTSDISRLLMGVQASLWTEFCNNPYDVDYLLFPRLSALAEVAWTRPERKDWPSYLKAMDRLNAHVEAKGITCARSMYNIQQTVTPADGRLQVSLDCIRPDVEIRYTTDGSMPAAQSALYTKELFFDAACTLRAATFAGGRQMGCTLELPVGRNKATGKPIRGAGANGLYTLVNGVRGSLKYTDSEWCSWAKNDTVSFTIDLEKPEAVSRLTLGTITNYGMAAHKPAKIEAWLSADDKDYRKAAERTFDGADIFREGTFKEDVTLDIDHTARYVRIVACGAGHCPATHVRPGQEARIYFDEVMVE
ncbi:family 20 glycosylhydrolase [Bacteroides helcogenes]|uniref:beta-N-acetylhexosaminidase n=1 Tax=Bacteroides helcogenes (strain ATCC 35417 / DSM 20613 / JCM 6297 / CCUG 15421 / P 36-108) TaxID=693979 RepID=E6SVI5_BACT6|nr:family 20 glycosylhydrolase [Bacteroides helcogenes]ADV42495.1 Beta-N-acetylhexosaminidase [Bacteroides helcogenes P 36-108]MDY5237744.1 family 20 glycosylhydrolase [Bacteroides helcogenes]